MGLRFPDDLDAWRAWQARRHPERMVVASARRLRSRWTEPTNDAGAGDRDDDLYLWVHGEPTVLIGLDSATPSTLAALLAPAEHLANVAVVATRSVGANLDQAWWEHPVPWGARGGDLDRVHSVGVLGAFLRTGAEVCAWARLRGISPTVIQHGLLTPLTPPLPRESRLLSWSEEDAGFWRSGRTDVSHHTVGSQLLWQAAEHPGVSADGPPLYLGQLHGAELPRHRTASAAREFCLAHGATYRPHPSERDRVSRLIHARWRRAGIEIDDSRVPLLEVRRPVVAVFSTGVLEAAARGLAAYVDFPDPPAWLSEFWDRYRMRPYGGPPTPMPTRGETAPAAEIARLLEEK